MVCPPIGCSSFFCGRPNMFRIRGIAVQAVVLALVATCSSSPPPEPEPTDGRVQAAVELAAVSLGVAIDARDERNAPRLIRAVVPRPAAGGRAPDEAARDHVAALAPLWIQHQQ